MFVVQYQLVQKVFSVGYNMSDDGSMAFITSRLELIKEVIEKYKKVTRLFVPRCFGDRE